MEMRYTHVFGGREVEKLKGAGGGGSMRSKGDESNGAGGYVRSACDESKENGWWWVISKGVDERGGTYWK